LSWTLTPLEPWSPDGAGQLIDLAGKVNDLDKPAAASDARPE
jgi:hypothetical protein